MEIEYIGVGSETLLDEFAKAGVQLERIKPPQGVIMNAGNALEVAAAFIPKAFAAMTSWLKARPSRRIHITFKNHQIAVFDAENYNIEEVLKVLSEVRNVRALETKKPEPPV